jgi:TPP-dependent pyruvate/acetoin dehydrogenase alpha subunit
MLQQIENNEVIDQSTSNTSIQTNIEKELLKNMIWLRMCEETLVKLYPEQEMRTPCHFATGQEAIATGVCQALSQGDVVYSHHRCHNHYLAAGGSFFKLAAELYGRLEGCSNGKGGSVHLTARDKGFIISSAILGEDIAVAAGSAFAFKIDKLPYVAVPFFGDASCEEGSFYETLNFASLNKIPALFICENNLYSTESHIDIRAASGATIHGRAKALGIETAAIDGNNVFEVYNTVKSVLPKIRSGNGPFFLECATYRWREHVGPNFDYNVPNRTYRSKEEQEYWINERCPIKSAKQLLLNNGTVTAVEIENWEASMQIEIDDAIKRAKQGTWPDVSSLLENVY